MTGFGTVRQGSERAISDSYEDRYGDSYRDVGRARATSGANDEQYQAVMRQHRNAVGSSNVAMSRENTARLIEALGEDSAGSATPKHRRKSLFDSGEADESGKLKMVEGQEVDMEALAAIMPPDLSRAKLKEAAWVEAVEELLKQKFMYEHRLLGLSASDQDYLLPASDDTNISPHGLLKRQLLSRLQLVLDVYQPPQLFLGGGITDTEPSLRFRSAMVTHTATSLVQHRSTLGRVLQGDKAPFESFDRKRSEERRSTLRRMIEQALADPDVRHDLQQLGIPMAPWREDTPQEGIPLPLNAAEEAQLAIEQRQEERLRSVLVSALAEQFEEYGLDAATDEEGLPWKDRIMLQTIKRTIASALARAWENLGVPYGDGHRKPGRLRRKIQSRAESGASDHLDQDAIGMSRSGSPRHHSRLSRYRAAGGLLSVAEADADGDPSDSGLGSRFPRLSPRQHTPRDISARVKDELEAEELAAAVGSSAAEAMGPEFPRLPPGMLDVGVAPLPRASSRTSNSSFVLRHTTPRPESPTRTLPFSVYDDSPDLEDGFLASSMRSIDALVGEVKAALQAQEKAGERSHQPSASVPPIDTSAAPPRNSGRSSSLSPLAAVHHDGVESEDRADKSHEWLSAVEHSSRPLMPMPPTSPPQHPHSHIVSPLKVARAITKASQSEAQHPFSTVSGELKGYMDATNIDEKLLHFEQHESDHLRHLLKSMKYVSLAQRPFIDVFRFPLTKLKFCSLIPFYRLFLGSLVPSFLYLGTA